MMEEQLYFAYGSNINLDQMAQRCPRATPVGPVMLENYELLFRGASDHDGVATIRPKPGSYVYGLMWKLTPDCEQSLDFYEGWPYLYRKEQVQVFDASGHKVSVMAYVMNDRHRVPSLPSQHYYRGIRDGFLQNRLPVKHLEQALEQARQEVAAPVLPRKGSHRKQKATKEVR